MQEPDIEIHDSEINAEEIAVRLRARLDARRAQAHAHGLDYDALVDVRAPEIAAHQSDADFESNLRRLQTGADTILVSPAMRDRRFRFFNAIFYQLENLLHRLTLKYVNQSAGKQIVFNLAAANVIATLARRLEQNQARTQELEQKVHALRERVADLERAREAD